MTTVSESKQLPTALDRKFVLASTVPVLEQLGIDVNAVLGIAFTANRVFVTCVKPPPDWVPGSTQIPPSIPTEDGGVETVEYEAEVLDFADEPGPNYPPEEL